jgi:membrane protease YdiL (CAAX protease family)
VILICWHVASRGPWRVVPLDLVGMLIESLVLAIPLLLLGMVASHYLPMLAMKQLLPGLLVLSVGAGVYEELVFRLAAFTVLTILFVDIMKMRKTWAYLLMVLISALAFSLYHYWGYESFQWRTFAFRTAAGIYFGIVFAFRGFGISSGTHSAYDVIVSLIRSLP